MKSSSKSRLVLLGPPAAGKGSVAKLLTKHLAIPAGSTGAMLRQEVKSGSEIGKFAEAYTKQGKLFTDDIALQVVEAWLLRNGNQFILDGFPRTVGQAHAFEKMLAEKSLSVDIVFALELSVESIEQRILSRLTCSSCGSTFSTKLDKNLTVGSACPSCSKPLERRQDDNPETLRERLIQHRQLSAPVEDFYQERNLLVRINADQAPQAVFDEIALHL
ncbi:MAG: adenylate kinase family protein [Chthoniobacterales bacterium]